MERAGILDKIHSKTIRVPSGCLIWTGRKSRGYGTIREGGRFRNVTRILMEEALGRPLHTKEHVCHKCDNPPCVEISHLFIGTAKDNVHDMINKGRGRRAYGEASGRAKLSESTVEEIKKLYAAGGWTQRALGQVYGVSHNSIGWVLRGRSWTKPSGVHVMKEVASNSTKA